MESSLLSLSVELLVEILRYLSYYDLIACRQVSKQLGRIVLQTSALQYKIELGLTGNQDGASKSEVPRRLELLRRMQRDWETATINLQETVFVPSQDWSQSKWQKDVFFGRYPLDDRRLDIFNFSSAYRDRERLQSLEFDVDFDVYCVDVDQDLIVLARFSSVVSNEAGYKTPPMIYLRSLKDQGPHPRAQQACLNLASYGFSNAMYTLRARIQIAGEYLIFILHKSLPVDSLIVWHWPSGMVNALLHFSRDFICLHAMCVESGYMLVVNRAVAEPGWFGIYVYALNKEEETPALLATFELPKLKRDARGWMTASFYPRDHTSGVLTGGLAAGPTDFSPAAVLVQLQWDRQHTLYTPLTTFLSPKVVASKRVVPLNFSWNSWGPKSSRVFSEGNTVAVICGYRAIFPTYILDFSPATLHSHSSNYAGRTSSFSHSLETSPTILTSPMFVNPVITSLPYRLTVLEPPVATPQQHNHMNMAFVDVDGPKLVRAVCEDYVLIPSSLDIYSIAASSITQSTS